MCCVLILKVKEANILNVHTLIFFVFSLQKGYPPLCEACRNGNLEIIDLLFANGANQDIADKVHLLILYSKLHIRLKVELLVSNIIHEGLQVSCSECLQ